MKNIVILLFALHLSLPLPTQGATLPNGFTAWAVEQKVDWLLENMTLAEKINHMNTTPRGQGKTYKQKRDEHYGLPGFVSCDGPRGARWGSEKGVCFPVALQMAATWDVALLEDVGIAFAQQLKHLKANQLFAPGLNIVKHPLAGRNAEYFGEDPYLAGKLGAAQVRGIQSQGCLATPKHFACNPFETGRFRLNAIVSERVLREIYLPAFRLCVQEGQAGSIMTAYNRLNGHYASAHQDLLDILYGWGFGGYVVSDYGAEMESTARALKAGTHVEMPGWTWYTDAEIENAIADGSLPQEVFDSRLRKILTMKLDPGFHDPGVQRNAAPLKLVQQRTLARRVAAQGTVLLKNDQDLLPLKRGQSVALIGPFATDPTLMVGNQGSSTVHPERTIGLEQALTEILGDRVQTVRGCYALTHVGRIGDTHFPCRAQYFGNLQLEGPPLLERIETEIQKLSFSGSGAAISVEGYQGKGFGFNGQSALKIGGTPAYSASDEFSWCFWVYLPDQFPDKRAPLWSSYIWQRAEFDLTPAGLTFRVRTGRRPHVGRIRFSIPDRVWTHVAMVRRDGQLTVYLNGEQQDSIPLPSDIPAMPVAVGGDFRDRWNAHCSLDEIAVYNYALARSDLELLMAKQSLASGRLLYEDCEDPGKLTQQIETFPGITDPQNMSARWTGTFSADITGKYHFRVTSNGGVRFFVNGEKIFDQMQEAWVEGMVRQCWVPMVAGQNYDLTVEYANWFGKQRGPGGFVKFAYSVPVDPRDGIAQAVAAAEKQDVAVVVVGVPQQVLQAEANDNENYALPAYQNELIQAVAAANPKTVVLLNTAGGCDMRPWLESVPAVVEAFYGGQEAGYALRDVLYGDVNPCGKLPVTYPISIDQLETDLVQTTFETSVSAVGYRSFDKRQIEPLFPFGHGICYTDFSYSDLEVTKLGRDSVRVAFTLRNTGKRPGAEVIQVYVSDSACSEERPPHELKGFQKVFLTPGSAKRIELVLDAWAFSFFSETTEQWLLEPGSFTIAVGSSSRDIRLTGDVALP